WDLSSGRDLVGTHGHGGFIASVAVTPDCQAVVTTSNDRTLRFWDPATGRELRRRTVSAHPFVLPDGQSYLSVGSDKLLRVHDLATGKERAVLRGHEGHNPGHQFALAPDHQTLASWGSDKMIGLLDPASGKP